MTRLRIYPAVEMRCTGSCLKGIKIRSVDDGTTMQILVIEDNDVIGQTIQKGFREEHHDCVLMTDGRSGLQRAKEHGFDVIILDLMLPEMSGLEVLSELRQLGNSTPVIVLTAKGTVEERVEGLNTGADDYLVKPFEFAELKARVQAICRRTATATPPIRVVGDLTIDLAMRRVTAVGRPVDLSPTEFSILELLARSAGQVVTRKMLCEHVWGFHWEGTTNVIEVHVNHLRKKLDADRDESRIQTIRGRGYVLRTS